MCTVGLYSGSRENKEVMEISVKWMELGMWKTTVEGGWWGPKGTLGKAGEKRGERGGGGEISQKEIGMSWFLSCCCGKIP